MDEEGVDWEFTLVLIALVVCLVTGFIFGRVTAPSGERLVEKKVYVWEDNTERFDDIDDDLDNLLGRDSKREEVDKWGRIN